MGTTVTNKNGIEFDIDALATDVNGKADKDLINVSSNVSVCVESWHEGTEWYRVYSDGWCEQGGFKYASGYGTATDIILLKSYNNTNYFAMVCQSLNVNEDWNSNLNVIETSKATSLFSVRTSSANKGNAFYWEAKGYIR